MMNTYVFTCGYKSDLDKFKTLLTEKNSYICAELKVPFWNVWGEAIFEQWAIVYQAKDVIEMEILT